MDIFQPWVGILSVLEKTFYFILLFVIPLEEKGQGNQTSGQQCAKSQTMRSFMSQMLLVPGGGKRKQCLGSQMQSFVSEEQLVMKCSY